MITSATDIYSSQQVYTSKADKMREAVKAGDLQSIREILGEDKEILNKSPELAGELMVIAALHQTLALEIKKEMLDLLCKHGADPSLVVGKPVLTSGEAPLIVLAITSENLEIVRHLLEMNKDPNRKYTGLQGEYYLLSFAIEHLCPQEVVEILLEHGANPNLQPERMIFKAISRQSEATLRLLLQYHVDTNIKNNIGKTPLEMAYDCDINIIALLIDDQMRKKGELRVLDDLMVDTAFLHKLEDRQELRNYLYHAVPKPLNNKLETSNHLEGFLKIISQDAFPLTYALFQSIASKAY